VPFKEKSEITWKEKLLEKWLKNNILSSNAIFQQRNRILEACFSATWGYRYVAFQCTHQDFHCGCWYVDNDQSVECRVNCPTREGTTIFRAESLPEKLTLIYLDYACLSVLLGIIVTANFTGLDKLRKKKKLLRLLETTTQTSVTYYFLNIMAF